MVQADSLKGSVVDGRYVIAERVARGGMATVYRARDKRLERDVAVKLMHPHLAEQPNFTERFNKEARAAASLSSPYVVSVHDRGVWHTPEGSHAYLIMEYMAGPDLRSELMRLGSFNLGTALTLTEQALRALAASHRAGLIHRDVKPENVLLAAPLPPVSLFERPEIHAKMTDFGLARVVSSTTTASSTVMGTINYVAPEIITTGSAVAASDVYATGIMLYEFLTGELPFRADTPIATAYKHVNNPMPRVADKADWLPPAIDSFIALLTAKDPEDRPTDGAQALAALRTILPGIPEEDVIRRLPVLAVPPVPEAKAPEDGSWAAPQHEDSGASAHSPEHEESEADGPPPASAEGQPQHSQASASSAAEPGAPGAPGSPAGSVNPTTPLTTVTDVNLEASLAQPAPPKPPARASTRRRRVSAAIVALLAVIALLVAGWYYFLGPGKRVPVPDVVGQTYTQAEETLAAQGLDSERVDQYSDDVPPDQVISTDPDAEGRVHPDQPVTIIVSLGIEQVEVPDVVNTPIDEARNIVNQNRLDIVEEESYSEDIPEGVVISQSLQAGERVNHSTAITLTVSKGREPIEVPNVEGQTEADALAAIEDAELTVSTEYVFSDTIAKGAVIEQSPAEGTLFRGDPVSLTVSKGPEYIEVPNVISMSRDDAVKTLEDAGFTVRTDNVLGGFFGLVRDQTPAGGQTARVGSEIVISVV
ncbi:Stk1 family PASTA domain-containing Ser/Thr kinase [Actinomycetaceae bacterium L2_0104]